MRGRGGAGRHGPLRSTRQPATRHDSVLLGGLSGAASDDHDGDGIPRPDDDPRRHGDLHSGFRRSASPAPAPPRAPRPAGRAPRSRHRERTRPGERPPALMSIAWPLTAGSPRIRLRRPAPSSHGSYRRTRARRSGRGLGGRGALGKRGEVRKTVVIDHGDGRHGRFTPTPAGCSSGPGMRSRRGKRSPRWAPPETRTEHICTSKSGRTAAPSIPFPTSSPR